MKIVELRHLDGLKGNFLLNEKECVYATSILKERKIIPRLLYTNINEFLEQQHNFFDTFWNNSISAQERIRQIEGEIQPHHIDIIRNSKRAEFLFVSEVRSARSEVLILVDSIDFLRYLGESIATFDLVLVLRQGLLAEDERREQDYQPHPHENPPSHHGVPPLG